jgi:hypothetical protein
VTVQVATAVIDPARGTKLNDLIRALHDGYMKGESQPALDALQGTLTQEIEPLFTHLSFDQTTARRILTALVGTAAGAEGLTFERAEQLTMGMQAAIASSPELAKMHDKELKELFATLKSPDTFKPESFTRVALSFSRQLSQGR